MTTENSTCAACAKIGQPVKDFTIETYNPEDYGFGERSFKKLWSEGKWIVLFFYPADFTFVCPTELADLASIHPELVKNNVEVISMSTDTKFAHLAWRTSERLLENVKFHMGSDATGEVSRYFGVYDEAGGTAFRGTFIISPQGVLVGSEVNFYNVGRNAAELLRKMEANKYLIDNPAEVCPARWTPGQKTLTPSEKMVGHVYEALNPEK